VQKYNVYLEVNALRAIFTVESLSSIVIKALRAIPYVNGRKKSEANAKRFAQTPGYSFVNGRIDVAFKLPSSRHYWLFFLRRRLMAIELQGMKE
jgi:hypothetical protein